MVLLKSMRQSKEGSLVGKTEKGKKVKLGIPKAHLKTFYTDAIKQGNEKIEAWERDLKKSRGKLLTIARQDKENYYDIPEKPYKTTMYDIMFTYLTFEKS